SRLEKARRIRRATNYGTPAPGRQCSLSAAHRLTAGRQRKDMGKAKKRRTSQLVKGRIIARQLRRAKGAKHKLIVRCISPVGSQHSPQKNPSTVGRGRNRSFC